LGGCGTQDDSTLGRCVDRQRSFVLAAILQCSCQSGSCSDREDDGDRREDSATTQGADPTSSLRLRAPHQICDSRHHVVLVHRERPCEAVDVGLAEWDARSLSAPHRPDEISIGGQRVGDAITTILDPPQRAASRHEPGDQVDLERAARRRYAVQVDLVQVREQAREGVPGGSYPSFERAELAGREAAAGRLGKVLQREYVALASAAKLSAEPLRPALWLHHDARSKLEH
jgi:hypothetical protein